MATKEEYIQVMIQFSMILNKKRELEQKLGQPIKTKLDQARTRHDVTKVISMLDKLQQEVLDELRNTDFDMSHSSYVLTYLDFEANRRKRAFRK